MMLALAMAAFVLALLPLLMAVRNLRLFSPPQALPPPATRVSLLVPARDEAGTIADCVRALLASSGVEIEVIVLDDQSGDDTAPMVRRLAERDARLRLVCAPPLPAGWAGKQRACALLAQHARHEVLLFVDADVRLAPHAAALAAGFLLRDARLGLVSGFPRELAGSWGERLMIPWIHVLLLGYLPIDAMRRSPWGAFGAGCGQWMVARRDAYFECGGHADAPASRHDGTSLPRSFRARGWRTDLFDATPLASCRMYRNFAEVWQGFGKSAGEGLATPLGLPVWTLLLLGGHVLPWLLLPIAVLAAEPLAAWLAALGIACNLLLRGLLARRFHQHFLGVLLHAPAALLVLLLNGSALLRHLSGRPSRWRGRSYVRGAASGLAKEAKLQAAAQAGEPPAPGRQPPPSAV